MYFLFSEKTLKGFLCSVMWCQLFWCGQYFIFMGNVKNIFYCYFFPVRYKIFSNQTSLCEVSSLSESRGHLCKYLFCKLEAGYLSFELLQLLCEQAVAFVNLFSNNLMLSRTLQLSNLRSIMSIVTCSWTMIYRCR